MSTQDQSQPRAAGEAAQLSAGNRANIPKHGRGKLWHTNSDGLYWCGSWYHRSPLELLRECESTVADLLKNHPELAPKSSHAALVERASNLDLIAETMRQCPHVDFGFCDAEQSDERPHGYYVELDGCEPLTIEGCATIDELATKLRAALQLAKEGR
jgi:hypothetical protein